ncbi:hypothetical protein C8J56DRAFT_232910 [Mycena floridula]|nr:hypothetical protein C8J56DRAFT_232910 [Mycena floridula]
MASGSFRYSDSRRKQSPKKASLAIRLERVRLELQTDPVLIQCRDTLQTIKVILSPKLLCLGLGSPRASKNSLAQLAFLLELCDSLQVNYDIVTLYDPVFSEEDRSLFLELGLQVLSDEVKDPVADKPTVFFMPHCDLELYEHVLKTNWTPERLSNAVFVSNHFADYVESNPARKLAAKAPCLLRIVPFLTSHLLPASASYPTAFNNMSVQFLVSSVQLFEAGPESGNLKGPLESGPKDDLGDKKCR